MNSTQLYITGSVVLYLTSLILRAIQFGKFKERDPEAGWKDTFQPDDICKWEMVFDIAVFTILVIAGFRILFQTSSSGLSI